MGKIPENHKECVNELQDIYYRYYNPKNILKETGQEVVLKIVFDETDSDNIKLSEGISDEVSEEYQEETTQGEAGNDFEQRDAVDESYMTEEVLAINGEVSRCDNQSSTTSTHTKKRGVNRCLIIPELEEIAKKSTSFDNFAELVAKWLGVGRKTEDIKELLIVSAEIDELSMNALKKAFQNKNASFFHYATILLRKSFNEKWTEHDVSPMTFLYAIRKYRTYPFKLSETAEESYAAEQKKANEQVSEESVQTAVTKCNEVVIPKARVKMECMPEIKDFEEVLANVDKTQSVKERIRYVLEAMGLETFELSERKRIIEYTSKRIVKKKADDDDKANDDLINHMLMSKLISNFVKKYDPDRKVSCNTFIYELRRIIMLESEIEE